MPVRIFDIAKKLGLENKVLLTKAKEMGIAAAKVPSSSLDKISAEWLEDELLKELGIQPKRGLLTMKLGHFKAFAEAQNIPIRPLTLIFGANSSGKSSVIHGLLLANEAVKTGKADIHKTDLGGESVDLGGFRQFVHRRRVADRVEWSAEFETKNLSGNAYLVLSRHVAFKATLIFGMPLDDKGKPQTGRPPRLLFYDIKAGPKLILRLSNREDGTMQLLSYDAESIRPIAMALLNAATSTTTKLASEEDQATINKTIEVLSNELRFECEGLLPDRIAGLPAGASTLAQWFAIPRSDRQKQLADATRTFFPRALLELVKGVNDELRKHLGKLLYLGPLRSFPPRHLAFLEDNDPNWKAGGGYAWDAVKEDEQLRGLVNQWLSSNDRLKTPYRLEIEKYYAASDIMAGLDTGFSNVAEDIVAQLMGGNQPGQDQVTRLLVERHKLDEEQKKLEGRLVETKSIIAKLEQQHEIASENHDKVTDALEKKRLELEVVMQTPAETPELAGHRNEDYLSKEIALLEDRLKNIEEVLAMLNETKSGQDKILKNCEAELEDLLREKSAVSSELTYNIDSDRNVDELFNGISGRPEGSPIDELILRDMRTDTRVSHRDVGIGVSQVLPVLVHAYADREKIVAIEQPEIHLHPKMQAELGDLFIESALGKQANTFLLETHSEHMILRILRRVRESSENKADYPASLPKIRPEDITVIYVEPTPKGSVVKVLTVTPDGDFAEPWPGGFFADRLEDLP